MIHTDLKPENVSLCLNEQEIMEIAKKGRLSTHKNYDADKDLEKIAE